MIKQAKRFVVDAFTWNGIWNKGFTRRIIYNILYVIKKLIQSFFSCFIPEKIICILFFVYIQYLMFMYSVHNFFELVVAPFIASVILYWSVAYIFKNRRKKIKLKRKYLLYNDAINILKSIQESVNIVNTTDDAIDFFQNLKWIIKSLKDLSAMEKKIKFSQGNPKDDLTRILENKNNTINDFIDRCYDSTINKMKNCRSLEDEEKIKTNYYLIGLYEEDMSKENIENYKDRLSKLNKSTNRFEKSNDVKQVPSKPKSKRKMTENDTFIYAALCERSKRMQEYAEEIGFNNDPD